MSTPYRLTLPPVAVETAEPGARTVLEEARRTRMIPNMYALMANSPGALDRAFEARKWKAA